MSKASPILSPEALVQNLADYSLLDARPGAAAYAAGHLPGAFHADLNRDLSTAEEPSFDAAKGGRHPLPTPERFAERLRAWGIRRDRKVAIYDAQNGANAASRAWWMLRALGHEQVFVVDGGLEALKSAGLQTTTAAPTLSPASESWPKVWQAKTVTIEEVEDLAKRSDWKLLDVRSRVRFRGEEETLDPVAGHVPGALNLPLTENLEPSGRFKSPSALQAMYSSFLGETAPDHLIVSCGSGVTACHTLLALEAAGILGARLFVGSFSEWCRSTRPLARGE